MQTSQQSGRRYLLATMTMSTVLTHAAVGHAETFKTQELQGGTFTVGVVHGVGYYTVQDDGYHLVLTLTKGTEKPVRFEVTLSDKQSITLSSPRAEGKNSESITVERKGPEITVTKDVDAPPIDNDN